MINISTILTSTKQHTGNMCCGVVSILCSLSQGQSFLFLISLQVQVTGKPLVLSNFVFNFYR